MIQRVFCGIDNIEYTTKLKNKRVGLITNQTGVNRSLKSTIDILNEGFNLVCLMSPEHGIRGDLQAGDGVKSYVDGRTGLPVYSLYGENCHIVESIMETIDAVVFDIQVVGARFYTYLYTLSYAMEDCAKANKTVVVLDRPNPISANTIEGTILEPEFASFIGKFPIATRTGMTIGEFAGFINKEYNIHCDLEVIEMTDYDRTMYYDQTDLIWIAPSPNLPTIDSCICYIGTCLFEGTNLSEGRGTTKPFEVIGAPWLNVGNVITIMKAHHIKGVKYRETYFKPSFSKFKDELCHGIQFHIFDRASFEPFKMGVLLIDVINRLHPEFKFLKPLDIKGNVDETKPFFIDLLMGTNAIRGAEFNLDNFIAVQSEKCKKYEEITKKYNLY